MSTYGTFGGMFYIPVSGEGKRPRRKCPRGICPGEYFQWGMFYTPPANIPPCYYNNIPYISGRIVN